MGKVLTHMTMSLDGFIADPNDQVAELFDWYEGGETVVPNPNEDVSFKVDDASADMLEGWTTGVGALVAGRRLFDIANGWKDNHPAGARVVVVTHRAPEDAAETWPKTTFVDGVEAAITQAKEIAGDQNVTIASPAVIQQALDLGLVDEVRQSRSGAVRRGHPLFREAGAGPSTAGRPDGRPGPPCPAPELRRTAQVAPK